ncbi:MAG: serine protease [Chloroflexi bacterium]|nr:serine protease [Chloroflexota bacterium]
MSRLRSIRRLSIPMACAAPILALSLLAPAAPTSAAIDPHTSVSSDGAAVATNTEGVTISSGEAYSPSHQGDGKQAIGRDRQVDDMDVPPATPDGQEVGITSVIGADNRVRITATTTYPYRAIAKITSSIGGCTGWLIDANTVVTAGHCVHGGGGWATNVRVYPGRNGTSTPYGSCGASRLFSVNGWTSDRDPAYDYGAIKLNCSIGNQTGWFGYRWQSASLNGQATNLAGYPGDKTANTLWRDNDTVRSTATRRLYYANDTAGGQSGSPVWNNGANCSTCSIAVHAYGVGSNGYNGGTRITEAVFNNLTNWKNS